ncbi:MAG: hypothetical protein H0T42_19410 [Deltaproteobacteria bacterium]|nr:hypothetical protein [Deltaproteobacteria bacterium]
MLRIALVAMLCGHASVATGCLMPRPQPASSFSSDGSWVEGFSRQPGTGPLRCTVYPRQFKSWDQPLKLPAECTSEAWVRQLVRDIHQLRPCFRREPTSEVRFRLEIDSKGSVTGVVLQPTQYANLSPRVRACIGDTFKYWQFVPAATGDEFSVVYQP